MAMCMARKKRVDELMAKREATFHQRNDKAVERILSDSQSVFCKMDRVGRGLRG
jgi:hypothetical protein